MLDIPQPLRKIYIIDMRILKACHFIPKQRELFFAVFAYFVHCGTFIHKLSVMKNRYMELESGVVGQSLSFPCIVRVKYRQRLTRIEFFVMHTYEIRYCFPAVVSPITGTDEYRDKYEYDFNPLSMSLIVLPSHSYSSIKVCANPAI